MARFAIWSAGKWSVIWGNWGSSSQSGASMQYPFWGLRRLVRPRQPQEQRASSRRVRFAQCLLATRFKKEGGKSGERNFSKLARFDSLVIKILFSMDPLHYSQVFFRIYSSTRPVESILKMVSAEKEPERTLGQKRSRGASPNGHSDFSDDEREGGSSK